MTSKDQLNKLHNTDIYSIMLFVLFRLKGTKEYSSLSELCYVLDKNNLLRLCEYFGGQTITIPTIEDLQCMIYSMLLWQYINIENMSYEQAFQLINCPKEFQKRVTKEYPTIEHILAQYTFTPRGLEQ